MKFTATDKLDARLEEEMRSAPGSARRVVFGPGTTWFLWYLFGSHPRYSTGLSAAIDENVKDVRKTYTSLRCVALGPANNFVMIWQDGSMSFNLDNNYLVLSQALDDCEGEDVSVSFPFNSSDLNLDIAYISTTAYRAKSQQEWRLFCILRQN
jgi:hypothetical protein